MGEEDNVGLQKGDGYVPGIVGFAQKLDQLRGQLWLRLTQTNSLQQSLNNPSTTSCLVVL